MSNIFIEGAPNYPKDFTSIRSQRSVADDRVEKYTHEILKQFKDYDWHDKKVIATGNVAIIGLRNANDYNSYDVYVAKNYQHFNVRKDELITWAEPQQEAEQSE